MKNIFFSIFLFSALGSAYAQNLVPNGNFETYHSCPTDISQLDTATFWITPTTGTSDYFNQCATGTPVDVPTNQVGFQYPHSGTGYSGIFFFDMLLTLGLEYREYLEVPLTSPLTSGTCYHFEMYMSLANTSAYSVSNISVHFSDTIVTDVSNYDTLPLVPQINNVNGQIGDTSGWVLFSGNYSAHGGESFLLIGSFQSDALTDTDFVNSNTTIEHYAYYYIDDVSLLPCSVTVISEPNENSGITVYPNPFIDELTVRTNDNEASDIILYDVTSRIVLRQSFTNSASIQAGGLAKGIYFYEIRKKDSVMETGKIIRQ